MGNLQVRFLEGWAPAMAPGYSTIKSLRASNHTTGSELSNSAQTRRSAASMLRGNKISSGKTYMTHPHPEPERPRVCETELTVCKRTVRGASTPVTYCNQAVTALLETVK